MPHDCFELPAIWPQAYGPAVCRARLRASPQDFMVDEVLGFAPDGEGEHALLRIRKTGLNTAAVARRLAEIAGVRVREVSYAGMKDRDAVTSQWFSVWLPGRPDPDWTQVEDRDVTLIEHGRHRRKLRRGCHRGNRFRLVLSEFDGDRERVEGVLDRVAREGVPNYFGPQRFGRAGGNVAAALGLFRGEFNCRDRQRRGIYLSAARSLLFNRVLAARVAAGSWNRALAGEVLMLDGSHSIFDIEQPNAEIDQRIARMDVHPTGVMWGRGTPRATGIALTEETAALRGCDELMVGLEEAGLKQERRSLRLVPGDFLWQFESADQLTLSFSLPPGSYATTVVAAIADVGDVVVPGGVTDGLSHQASS